MTDDTWRGSYVTLFCGGLYGTPSHRLGLSPAATGDAEAQAAETVAGHD
jgi:hypothetical protein